MTNRMQEIYQRLEQIREQMRDLKQEERNLRDEVCERLNVRKGEVIEDQRSGQKGKVAHCQGEFWDSLDDNPDGSYQVYPRVSIYAHPLLKDGVNFHSRNTVPMLVVGEGFPIFRASRSVKS